MKFQLPLMKFHTSLQRFHALHQRKNYFFQIYIFNLLKFALLLCINKKGHSQTILLQIISKCPRFSPRTHIRLDTYQISEKLPKIWCPKSVQSVAKIIQIHTNSYKQKNHLLPSVILFFVEFFKSSFSQCEGSALPLS